MGIVSEPVVDAGGTQPLSDLVRARAHRTPDAVAILGLEGTALTFSGLAAQLDVVELELRSFDIGPEDRVAVVLPDGPELATAFVGLASAAACAPLNPAYREQELAFYLSDLGASAVVVGPDARSTAARNAAERLGLLTLELHPLANGAGSFTLRRASAARHGSREERDRAALLLHTSGTTARPKLVPLTQANLCASASAVAASLELTPDDRCLAVMPLFHIHGLVASVLAPVASGSTVVCTNGFDAARFLPWLEAFRPSWYTAVPTMHMAVLERGRSAGDPSLRRHLRLVRSSSAALPAPVGEGLEALFGCPVLEAYGMTEAAHQMAANPLPPEERKPGSVGRAAGPEIAVLDDEGRELDAGEIGEVSVRGPNVFSGYERNPDANRTSFTSGWFRTGDQGYVDDDGYLFLSGRIKEIINRGGEKVSPREVEEVVLAHPEVADVVAFARPHTRLGEDVAAAVVLRGGPVDAQEIQRFAASRLAPFKIPSTLVFLDELPKGPTGKVQRVGMSERLGLPELGPASGARAPFTAPRTPLEERLCALWEELLEVDRVGIHDDFIGLGGDSLLVAQLLAQLTDESEPAIAATAASLPASCILFAPNVERLAALLEEGWEPRRGLVAVEPDRAGRPFFFFPPHDWGTVGLGALGRKLEGDYALHTYELDEALRPDDVRSVEVLAARIAAEIREAQPQGPYVLGGVCFGGALALEVGRLLRAEGKDVSLALVNPIGERPGRVRARLRWLALMARRGTLRSWARRRAHRRGTPADPQQWLTSTLGLEGALDRASRDYEVAPYPGSVTVLAGADYTTPKRFWSTTAVGGLDWRPIPHGSGAVFRMRQLDALAAELDDVLAQL